MRKSKFTDSQIVATLKQVEGGRQVKDVCRELGEEFGGEQIQIDFAVLVLRIQADRGGSECNKLCHACTLRNRA